MDIVKDIADIMRKYKNRHWKVSIDDLNLTIWIEPETEDCEHDYENWIKIVYEYWQFNEPYLSLKQTKKIYKEYKENGFEFEGLSLIDLVPVICVMDYIQDNHESIRDTINEYYTVHSPKLCAENINLKYLHDSYSLGTGGD